MILDCDRLWTRLVSAMFRIVRRPRVSQPPPRTAFIRRTRR